MAARKDPIPTMPLSAADWVKKNRGTSSVKAKPKSKPEKKPNPATGGVRG